MKTLLLRVDAVLRSHPSHFAGVRVELPLSLLIGCIFICGLFYGAVMGSFGGVAGERIWQVLFSSIKVPLLLLVTFVITLPSFFVLNTLLEVRADFPEAVRAVFVAQAGLAIVLASFAPYTMLWYASSADYQEAILFNAFMFAAASAAAQGLLRRHYRPLVERNAKHRWLMRSWLVLYAFVGIQMGWILRPFVGGPDTPTQFFREDSWGNAYVVVGRLIWEH